MIVFEDPNISNKNTTEANIRIIKSYLSNLADSLNMLSQEVASIKETLSTITEGDSE